MKKVLLSMLVMLAGTSAWAQKFTSDGETLTITTDGDMTNAEVAAKVAAKILSDNPTKVVVDGNGVVGDDFVHAILYPNGANATLTNLDMKDVTLSNWTSATFRNGANDVYQFGQLGLKEITLPMVKANAEGQVVVPSDAFKPVNQYYVFPITSVVIPEGYTEIGAYAFNSQTNISSVSFPSTLKTIGDMAFANLVNWKNPKLNEGLEFIGNSAFALTNAVVNKTLQVPSSVKYMGPGAFLFRQYQEVYFRGVEAPMCPLGKSLIQPYWGLQGTFGGETLMGNNGFNADGGDLADNARSEGKANRENYKNNGVYFCIMHYPNNLTDEQRAKYTDITKTYETWEGNQWGATTGFDFSTTKVVGQENGNLTFKLGWQDYSTYNGAVNPGYKDTYLGEQYIWPSQSQWMRSYITASNGLCWDGVTAYKPTLTAEQIALLRKAGYSESEYSEDALAKIAYIGTRQFVLGNGDVKSQEHDYPLNVKGGKWYTFCVPFNMTKKMVDEAMGVGTQVCRFSSVERKFDETEKYNRITLLFRADVYKHKTGKTNGVYDRFDNDGVAPSDDDIVIYAHEAYMVKPTKTDADPKSYVVSEYEPEVGSPLPTYITSKNKVREQGMSQFAEEDGAEYRFVGNYLSDARTKIMMPQYTYFFGRMKPEDMGQFWFYDGSSPVKWNANSCIVQTTEAEAGAEDAESFFNVVAGASNKAKQFSIFGEDSSDNSTTGVDNVTIVAGEDAEVVYSLNGQVASHNGETNSLPKGVYIKNGKKFIVK